MNTVSTRFQGIRNCACYLPVGSPEGSEDKELSAMQETQETWEIQVQSLGREDPLNGNLLHLAGRPGLCLTNWAGGPKAGSTGRMSEPLLGLSLLHLSIAPRPSGYPPGVPNPTGSLAEPLTGQSLG